jgi:integrase
MASITSREVAAFRDSLATRLAVGTVNIILKIIRIVFEDAHKEKLVGSNEAKTVSVLKASADKAARRPFTEKELRRVLELASPEWRAMILTGFYAGGQRLGDVARLTWQNADLAREEIRFVTRKTRRAQVVPMVPVLHQCLSALPSSDDPKAPVFPHALSRLRASKGEHIGALSNEFHDLLMEAGLAHAHSHERTGKGHGGRREVGELGFHSLRHTFTSWAKSAGIGSAIVQDIVGHDSEAISAHYTTIDDASKRAALSGLPDLTKPAAHALKRPSLPGS